MRPCCMSLDIGAETRSVWIVNSASGSVTVPLRNWWQNLHRRSYLQNLRLQMHHAPIMRITRRVGPWLKVLKEDKRAILTAASEASQAADYLSTNSFKFSFKQAKSTPFIIIFCRLSLFCMYISVFG